MILEFLPYFAVKGNEKEIKIHDTKNPHFRGFKEKLKVTNYTLSKACLRSVIISS